MFEEEKWAQTVEMLASSHIFEERTQQQEAKEAVLGACYGNHPLLKFFTLEAIRAADINWVRQWWPTLFTNPAEWYIEVIGDLEGSKEQYVKDAVCKYVGSLPKKEGAESTAEAVSVRFHSLGPHFQLQLRFPPGVEVKTVYFGAAELEPQAIVTFAYGLPPFTTDLDSAVCWMINLWITDQLLRVLRQQEASIYGVEVVNEENFGPACPALNSVRFVCDPKRVDKLIELSLRYLKQLYYRGFERADASQILRVFKNSQQTLPKAERLKIEPEAYPTFVRPSELSDSGSELSLLTSL